MLDITKILVSLGRRRPIFHSEADFQHAFAWEIQEQLPNASLRLEYPFPPKGHLDILVIQKSGNIAIELKYKTCLLSLQVGDEQFSLKGHNARDCGRYDFINDIERLEQIVDDGVGAVGYAVLLTNDSLYWKTTHRQTNDKAFRLHEGRELQGKLDWATSASAGTADARNEPLRLKGTYQIHWEDYAHPSSESYGLFRYLVVRVNK